jgi:transposase
MTDSIKEFEKKAKEVQDQQPKIEIRDVVSEPYQGRSKSEAKREDLKKVKTKNQLITVPNPVDFSYDGKKKEEDLEVDDPADVLCQKFRDGEIETSDLTPDDKFVMIRHMRQTEGMKPDDIAKELQVTRRTVFNYLKKIKEFNAKKLADSTSWEIGGDLYEKGLQAMEMALKANKPKDFAYVVTSLISTLQSMGLIFKMPQRSQVQQHILQEMKGVEGFNKLQKAADENDEVTIDAVYAEIMDAVKEGKIEKADE